ncbi:hypothetical protein ACFOEM_11450 [Paenalcaligenes hominis]|uniref:hypothetical protein n=1 Tax=Paenalcaligenes hominis TaxID=643674 RepID=UPI00361561D0
MHLRQDQPGTEAFLGERLSTQRNEVKRALPSEPMNGAASKSRLRTIPCRRTK